MWTYLALYTAGFLIAFPIVAAAAHRLQTGAAVAVGWAGFAVYQSVRVVFVR